MWQRGTASVRRGAGALVRANLAELCFNNNEKVALRHSARNFHSVDSKITFISYRGYHG